MKTAIGYIRVSTNGQADGVSLEAQAAKIDAWCTFNGYVLDKTFDDVLSGTKTDRPGLAKALSELKQGDALVVYSLSRLARSTKHTLEIGELLASKGADLVSLSESIDTTSATGKMIFKLLAVLAEFERDLISERTKGALAHLRSQGKRVGSIPYGFKLDPTDSTRLVINQSEREVIEIVNALRCQFFSYQDIGAELHNRGYTPRGGRSWHPQTLSNIFKSTE